MDAEIIGPSTFLVLGIWVVAVMLVGWATSSLSRREALWVWGTLNTAGGLWLLMLNGFQPMGWVGVSILWVASWTAGRAVIDAWNRS